MADRMKDEQNSLIESFQSFFGKEELLAKVIECFPYPLKFTLRTEQRCW